MIILSKGAMSRIVSGLANFVLKVLSPPQPVCELRGTGATQT